MANRDLVTFAQRYWSRPTSAASASLRASPWRSARVSTRVASRALTGCASWSCRARDWGLQPVPASWEWLGVQSIGCSERQAPPTHHRRVLRSPEWYECGAIGQNFPASVRSLDARRRMRSPRVPRVRRCRLGGRAESRRESSLHAHDARSCPPRRLGVLPQHAAKPEPQVAAWSAKPAPRAFGPSC